MFKWFKKKKKLELNWFKESEFACPCCGELPETSLMLWADKLRLHLMRPMKINSGMRCEKHNKRVGGAKFSQHKLGLAIDVHCPDEYYKRQLISHARELGAKGIGIYDNFVHLDLRVGPKARWKG